MNTQDNNEIFSQKDIEVLLQIGIRMLKKINIPISDSIDPKITFSKSRSAYGKCHHSRRNEFQRKHGVNTGYIYRIEISRYTLGSSQKSVINTLLHELLHTCKDCMNHGPLWKSYASKVNLHYGYDIKRCDGDKSQEDRMRLSGGDGSIKFAHKLVCDKCREFVFRRI